MNLCFRHSRKKVETSINIFNYLLQVRKPDVLHFSVGKKKKKQTVEQATIRLTRSNPDLPLLHFMAAFLIWFSMISCSPFFTYLSRLSKCSLPFLELCFILTFSNFHVHFLFGHEKKENAWDLRGHLSPMIKIYFQKQNHSQAKVDLIWRLLFENCSVTEVRAKHVSHSPLFRVIMKVLTNSDRFHTTFPSFFHCSMFKTIFFLSIPSPKKMLTNARNLNSCIVFMGEEQPVCIGENVTFLAV